MTIQRGLDLKRRYFYIVFFVSGLLILIHVAGFLTAAYYEKNWEQLATAEADRLLEEASRRFAVIQRETRRITTDLARSPLVSSYLEGRSLELGPLFQEAAEVSRTHHVGVEIFDDRGRLVAWSGSSGPVDSAEIAEALRGKLTSYILPSSLSSQLFVATPVRSGNTITGVVLVRNTIDTHYPLNNRYVDREGLSERILRDLGIPVRFDFSADENRVAEPGLESDVLYGIDSTKLGYVSVPVPNRDGLLEEIGTTFAYARGVVHVLLLVLLTVAAWRWIRNIRHILLRSLALTALIWLARYALVWLEVPSLFFPGGVFDPVFYATKFGSGLAKSIGELSLTSVALLINTLMITAFVAKGDVRPPTSKVPWPLPLRWGGAILLVTCFFLLLRAYGVIVRSAVFDSVLQYNDPAVIIPSFELALMVINLFTISLCIVIASAGLLSLVVVLVGRDGIGGWLVTGVMLAAGVVIGEQWGSFNLMTWDYRLMFSGLLLFYAYYLRSVIGKGNPRLTPGGLLIPLGLSAIFLSPQLDSRTEEKDRERIEVFAGQVLRPVDSWLTFVVDEALESLRKEEVASALQRANPDELERLTLTAWAGSSACREGYTSLFLLTDSLGREVSRFSIGDESVLPERGLTRQPPSGKLVQMREIGAGVNSFKVYRGSAPVTAGDRVLGHAFVLVAAGQQTLFRGDVPAFLRSAAPESIESFYRPVTVSEFRDGVLFASTQELFPAGAPLPAEAGELTTNPSIASFWSEITVGANRYEALFVRGTHEEGQVIVLSLPVQGVSSYLFNLVKVLVYYILVVLVVLVGYLAVRWARRAPLTITFRDRLLSALLLTAVAPLVVIAYYGKDFAEQRLMEETQRRLERETESVSIRILQEEGRDYGLTTGLAEQIATETGTDFNYYSGMSLQSSSRPELYAAGLLDRRLSGGAYAAVVLEGERFHQQTENIGRYRYAVGYRPVYDPQNSIVGVVSVPTLYRQDELDRQVSQQNAFLFGVYAVVFLAVVVLATTVASRIASPIHRLTEATRRVSLGEFDVTVGGGKAVGEIGELVRSFEAMTRNLRRQRDELVKYERELAWKEMAKQVAHEIKNPLTPMKLSLQHLRQTYRDRASDFGKILEDIVTTVIKQIDALSRIASEFSNFAQMPKANLETCDLNEIACEASRLFEGEKATTILKELHADPLPILADKEMLRRAFINIIRNGMQAMNNQGLMIVRTRVNGNRAEISFRDHGIGIPDDVKAKLFQPNFSTKTDGMGLGLAIVKETVDDLKGTIRVESTPGEGTEVVIDLPALPDGAR